MTRGLTSDKARVNKRRDGKNDECTLCLHTPEYGGAAMQCVDRGYEATLIKRSGELSCKPAFARKRYFKGCLAQFLEYRKQDGASGEHVCAVEPGDCVGTDCESRRRCGDRGDGCAGFMREGVILLYEAQHFKKGDNMSKLM